MDEESPKSRTGNIDSAERFSSAFKPACRLMADESLDPFSIMIQNAQMKLLKLLIKS